MQSFTLRSKIVSGLFSAIVIMTLALPGARAWADDICPGTYVGIRTAGLSPFVQLQVGDKKGWFIIDLAASYSIVDTQTFGMTFGESRELKISGFPYVDHEMFTAMDWHNFKIGGDPVLGLIGENVLSLVSVQLRYDADLPYLVVSPDSCTPYLKDNPDFVKIDQAGFYARDRSHLKRGVSNLPRLNVQVAGVNGSMLIDSGDSDTTMGDMPGAVHMNMSFIEALQGKGLMQLPKFLPDRSPCGGTDPMKDLVPTWVIDSPLQIVDTDRNVVFRDIQKTVVKEVSAACGDIYSSSAPLGLIPASYIRRLGTVILDAPGDAVWLRKSTILTTAQMPRLDLEWRPGNGKGSYTNSNGDTYEGEFRNGVAEGFGTWHLTSGDSYTGMNHDGKPDGKGTWHSKDGSAYKGTIRSWVFMYGELTNSVGDRFVGSFKNWLQEGQGTLIWANHDYYEGNFHNGMPEGHGKLWYANRSYYEGNFHNGKPEGHGYLKQFNGDQYNGDFVNGLQEGQGKLWFANHDRYDGLFRNGQPNGWGIYFNALSRYRFQALFRNGVLIGTR